MTNLRIGIPTSRHIGIDLKEQGGPLKQLLQGQYVCGIDLGQVIASGSSGPYRFRKGSESGRFQFVYQASSVIPSRTTLDRAYPEHMDIGLTGRDHWQEWALRPDAEGFVDSVVTPRFEACLGEGGIVPVVNFGFMPVYHIIAKPAAMKGNPLNNGAFSISTEYPIKLASYLFYTNQNTPLTVIITYPNPRGEERQLQNDVQGKDRKIVNIFVTPKKTELAGGVIADITQSGGSLVTNKYEPLAVVGYSTPLLAAKREIAERYPRFLASLQQVAVNAEGQGREMYPELYQTPFETAFDNAPQLIEEFKRLVTAVTTVTSSNGHANLADELVEERPQDVAICAP